MSKPNIQYDKFIRMTEHPVEKLVATMAIPTIISMLISAFYNMADTFFVGKIGTSATGAVGIVFSLMALIQATGFFFGHGSGNYISRQLGAQKTDEAQKMASTGFFSAFLAGILISIAGLLNLDSFARLLGATDTILPYAREYLKYILIGTPWMTAALVLNNQLRLQGSAFFSMIGMTAGAVLNIALDPLFIFVFDMGVGGAGLATMISQLVSCLVLLAGCYKKGNIPIRITCFTPKLHYFKQIASGGTPSLCRQGLASIASIVLNRAAGGFGDPAIAAISIVTRITMFASSALIGFGQGFQPVCGFNYGAKRYDRVMAAFWFCVKVAAVALVLFSAAGFIFAPQLIAVFRGDDPEVIRIGTTALRLQCIAFPVMSWVIMCNMLLQNINKTVRASILAAARQGLFFIPALLLLTPSLGILGIQLAQPVADLSTFLLALPLGLSVVKELKAEIRKSVRPSTVEFPPD